MPAHRGTDRYTLVVAFKCQSSLGLDVNATDVMLVEV